MPALRTICLHIIAFTLLLFVATGALAKPSDFLVDLWTSDNDLPDSSVTAITQTPDGYLWIGTYNGLARFDGVRFTTFDPANTPELKNPRIFGLFTDPRGTLWISTFDGSVTSYRDGVFKYEWQCGQIVSAFFPSNRTYLATLGRGVAVGINNGQSNLWQTLNEDPPSASSFCQDASGTIWCLLRDGRIKWISGTNVLSLPDNAGLGTEKVNCITADQSGRIWIGTSKWIAHWNGDHFEDATPTNSETVTNVSFLYCSSTNDFWAFVNDSVRHAVNGRWVTNAASWRDLLQTSPIYIGAYQEQNGDVWFRNYGQGLFHAGTDGTLERISSATGLPGDRVSAWFQDREGNLWVGVDRGGLVRLRKKLFHVIGLDDNFAVSTICEDSRNNVWIGTFENGLNRWSDNGLERFDLPEGVNRNSFFSAYPDAQGGLWLSADHEDLFRMESGRIMRFSQSVHGIKTILADHENRVWLGRQSQLTSWADEKLVNYGGRNGFDRRDVRALAEDQHGNIWIGTGNGVLYQFANEQFAAFKPDDALETQAIWSLLPDADGTLWVGTFRGGLLRFKDGKFTRYTTKNGLPSDVICQILDDGQGKLWIGSHKGIFCISKSIFAAFDRGEIGSIPCNAYSLNDGLPTLECTGNYQPSAWRTHDGKLWFATVKGAVMVNPAKIRLNRVAPPVALEDFLVDSKRFALTNPIEIPPGKHQFDFNFTALSFIAPDKVTFRYRLEPFDNAWVETGAKRAAHYGPLEPGDYKFQVIACNNDGVWNNIGASITFKQLPFFWQTWWFDFLVISAAVIAIAAAARYVATRKLHQRLEKLNQQRAIERERERIGRDLHDDLGAGLTQIMLQSSLARRESPDRMQADLAQISENASDLVRAMDEILWAINPENDTLDGLVTYLTQYVQEFLTTAKLRCRLDLPPETPAVVVPAELRHNLFLAIKEVLNNIAKHSHATEVLFQLKLDPHVFTLVIQDDGTGFVPGTAGAQNPLRISSGHGLANLERRLEQLGGKCTITSQPGKGTQVELTVPMDNQRRHEIK